MAFNKDYYDILGIRPTAKQTEIDLAYKGRRTQYHPDKYPNTDAETMRWATTKMQEVNEAYETLSNPQAKARYDLWRNEKDASDSCDDVFKENQDEQREYPQNSASLTDQPCLYDYLVSVPLNHQDKQRFHFAPHIPTHKLANALSSRRSFSSKPLNAVYLLIDDTVFQRGEDGLLITDEIISFKELFASSVDYRYANGWNSRFQANGTTISRYDKHCQRFSFISASAVQMLTLVINRFFADLFDWHVENAKRGNVQSQFILSHSCHDNPEEEYHWLSLAAENGHVIAQHNMGMYYFYKNPKMAFYWFTKAAAQGSKLSEDRLNSDVFKQFR